MSSSQQTVLDAVSSLGEGELRALLSEARGEAAAGGAAGGGLRAALVRFPALAAALLVALDRAGALHTTTPALLRAAGVGEEAQAAAAEPAPAPAPTPAAAGAAAAAAADADAATQSPAAIFARVLAMDEADVEAEVADDVRAALRVTRSAATATAAERAELPPAVREEVELARQQLVAAGIAVEER